jgi:1-aminocyclopropane-1-carboxylate deaminase/D-cysteine desulfhydrase-like pyridoxal-dependent ACC family enzyme
LLNGTKPELPNGNLLLDELLGAQIDWVQRFQRETKLSEVADELRKQGSKPYVIPVGGSNGVGATGYVMAMMELAKQLKEINRRVDHIVFASSSGGTQAGIVVGAKITGFDAKLHGVSIDWGESDAATYQCELAEIANETAKYVCFNGKFAMSDFNVVYDNLGGGYGIVSDLEREAIRLLASRDGIMLGPVYTGRAMGTLIDLIHKKAFRSDETVLFWHTGGAPALFAYAKDLI